MPASPPDAPVLRVREVRAFLRRGRMRMPFRFGNAVMTTTEILHLRVRAETPEGRTVQGVTGSALAPVWFNKDPGVPLASSTRDLLRSVRLAADAALAAPAATAWGLHHAQDGVSAAARAEGLNDLTAGFGTALLDAAAVDAVCRLAGASFHDALRRGLLGIPIPGPVFPETPLDRIAVRHTVGLADPITAQDVSAPLNDGLPETLEDVVRAYGVRYFKIKFSADADATIDRLVRIASVLDRDVPGYRATLDGNEQFTSADPFRDLVRRISAEPRLAGLWSRTLWFEQPIDRRHALEDDVRGPLADVARLKPVIIDESGGSDAALERALALGYRGISAKHCKGIFRTLVHDLQIREANRRGRGLLLSSEDLTNVPVVPLHQDTCAAAALGIEHSERNGHHYVRGFDLLSPREQEATLRRFPSLYRRLPGGSGALRIEGGEIDVREVNRYGYGDPDEPDWAAMETVELPERRM